MTICIAAIWNNDTIIGITDKMQTYQHGEFFFKDDNPDNKKIFELTDNAVAFISGNYNYAYEIIENAKASLKENKTYTVKEIVEEVEKAYSKKQEEHEDYYVKRTRKSETVRKLRDTYTVHDYDGMFQSIKEEADLRTDIMVAGIDFVDNDIQRRASLYRITNEKGEIIPPPRSIYCIGSGAALALPVLLEGNLNTTNLSNFATMVYTLYKAKQYAQRDLYVGNLTEMIIIDQASVKKKKSGETKSIIRSFRQETLEEFKTIYQKITKDIEKEASMHFEKSIQKNEDFKKP